MAREPQHDRIARRVARLHGGRYVQAKGADIIAPRLVGKVEVQTRKLGDGIRHLQGYRKPRYLVVPDRLVQEAQSRTKALKVGVMDQHGRVVKAAAQPKSANARGRSSKQRDDQARA